MGNFQGGSAYAMCQQIAGGFVLVTERTFQRLQRAELDKLDFEIEKLLREIRAEQSPIGDTKALQQRNRRLMRLNGARQMLRAYRLRRKT